MLSTIPPFGIADPASYLLGFSDAMEPFPVPDLPKYQEIVVDKRYYIAAGGSDSNTGAIGSPFASLDRAVKQAQADKSVAPGIYFNQGDTFNLSMNFPRGWKGLFRSYGEGASPLIQSNLNAPFNFLSSDTVQFFGLHFKTAANVEAPIIGNGLTNLWVDSCEMEGFAFGVELTGGPNDGVKIYRCNIHDQKPDPNSLNHCSGIYIQGAKYWEIAGNAIERCGLIDINPADPVAVAVANQRHGFYGNESGGMGDGVFSLNLVLEVPGSGCGSRVGGNYSYNVFRGGGDYHLIVQGANSYVSNNAFFGPVVDAPPNWGGGICSISDNCVVNGNWFAGNGKTTNNPWLTVKAGRTVAMNNRGQWTKVTPAVNNPPTARPFGPVPPPNSELVLNNAMPNIITAPSGAVATLAGFPLNIGAGIVPAILDWMNRSYRL